MIKGFDESLSQPLLLTFIPSGGCFKLFSGFLAYSYRFHLPLMRCLACASTCSGSRVRAGLASISLILLHTSRSQASARPESAGPSKLATKSLAKRARSVSESDNASALSVSSCAVVISTTSTATILQIMYQAGIHNKSRQQGRFAPGRRNRRPCFRRYVPVSVREFSKWRRYA
jgi:hypothetical protein